MKLYRYHVVFNRGQDIYGLFSVDEEEEACLEALIKSKQELHYGEILGHSYIKVPLERGDLKEVSATPEEVAVVRKVLGSGVIYGRSPLERAHEDWRDRYGHEPILPFLDYCRGLEV